ncbi:hypothetical protein ACGFWE_28470 [Streptomyces sp. NPDC048523]|uniref:hypothetical protein n=1 Tax=Streptomyces sp. NPDC048523 TaxID=3365567 RepID=UPI003724942D
MSDNVARIIAGASAAFTATSMAISYATFLRVRPRLRVRHFFEEVTRFHASGETTSCHLIIQIRNHGQTAVKLSKPLVQFRQSRLHRLLNPRSDRRGWDEYTWSPSIAEASDAVVDAFGGVRWNLLLPDTHLRTLAPRGARLRVGVELPSGVVVYGQWHWKPWRLPSPQGELEQHRQLSFDDLGSESSR